MADVTNVKIGVCTVSLGGVILGHTKGGVVVTYTPEFADITVDQYGNTVVDKVLIGEKLTAKVPLAETQIANLQKAIAEGTLAGSTSGRVTIGKDSGARLSTVSAQLILHPIANLVTNHDEDVVFHKAVSTGEIELNYMVDEERVVEVEFTALVKTDNSTGNYLGHIGDSTD